MSNLKALFQPLQLGPITLKNRIFMSAMTRNGSVPTNVPNGINVEYYQQRAAGGAGLIVMESILIVQQGSQWQNAPGIWSEEQEGGAIFAQLWHFGRLSHPNAPKQIASGQPVYAPSAIVARGGQFRFLAGQPGYITPTAIADPHTLLSQDPRHVRGGSVQNRAWFALEVVKIAADIWGADRVGIKLNPVAGYNDVGYGHDFKCQEVYTLADQWNRMPLQETLDTFRYLISELDNLGIAYVALVRYAESLDPVIDGARRRTKHDVLSRYAPLVKNPATRVFANASFMGKEASRYVEDGEVDGVFFGILWVANPDFMKRLEKGESLEENNNFMTLTGYGGLESDERQGYVNYPAAMF
ncbi:uncharacterized protein ARMOST_21691 [Armillaria ostoyae]|uniref:NADH:flavin oxidoreductase/NADH oxidase N-terminal domain-containing protein n=1 Tax=Armillaria ostoyae TaxID=47428 RepID=A0A284SAY4_ARMOS|nr:uncharacterized protein ARMOST_21691 [Armillaria ostoyae]